LRRNLIRIKYQETRVDEQGEERRVRIKSKVMKSDKRLLEPNDEGRVVGTLMTRHREGGFPLLISMLHEVLLGVDEDTVNGTIAGKNPRSIDETGPLMKVARPGSLENTGECSR